MKKKAIILLFILSAIYCRGQEPIGLLVKSNLLNALAKRPSVSVEKTFSSKYGIELSYTQGELNWGRDYKFDGFLLRAKVYASKIQPKYFLPFYGIYAGTLNKRIISNAEVHPTGFFSIGRNRNFDANSIRAGGNLGFLFIPKKRFLIEDTTGVGYGKYFNMNNRLTQQDERGYVDFQLWLSLGYSF